MIPDKLKEVLAHEGVAAIATQSAAEAHLVNTWNSYLTLTNDERLLFPAGGMRITEQNVSRDNRVLLTVGSRDVPGHRGPGTGFLIRGRAAFLTAGPDFDSLKTLFPWARAVVEIRIESITQTL